MLIFLFVHVACGVPFDSTQFTVSERRAHFVSRVRVVLTTGGCCFCQAFRKLLDGFGCASSSPTCSSPLRTFTAATNCPTSGTNDVTCNASGKILYIDLAGAAVQGTVLGAFLRGVFFSVAVFFNQGARTTHRSAQKSAYLRA